MYWRLDSTYFSEKINKFFFLLFPVFKIFQSGPAKSGGFAHGREAQDLIGERERKSTPAEGELCAGGGFSYICYRNKLKIITGVRITQQVTLAVKEFASYIWEGIYYGFGDFTIYILK